MSRPPSRPTSLRLFISRHRRFFFLALLFSCLGGAVYYYDLYNKLYKQVRIKLNNKPLIPIKQITITGATRSNEEAIRHDLPCHINDSLFLCDVDEAQKKIKSFPFIGDVTIYRYTHQNGHSAQSGEILIHVVERTPYAIWQHHGTFSVIDRDGEKVPDKGAENKAGIYFSHLPLVVGHDANKDNNAIIDTINTLPSLHAHIVAIIRINDRRWDLLLRNGTRVLLPQGHEINALTYLEKFDDNTVILDRPLKWIDLRLPDRITVRENTEKENTEKENTEKPNETGANTLKDQPPQKVIPQETQQPHSWQETIKNHIVNEDVIDDIPDP